MKFEINVKSTHITVSPGEASLEPLEQLLDKMVYEDEYATDGEELKVCGYVFDEVNDVLYLHKGVDLDYLRRLLINVKILVYDVDVYDKMKFDFEEVITPRDSYQYDIIDFFKGTGKHTDSEQRNQLLLPAGTGSGKTFTSSYAACDIGLRTIIIVHRASLIEQWVNTLTKMHGMPSKRIHVLNTDDLFNAAYHESDLDYDVFIMTHATFRMGIKRVGDFKQCENIFANLKIGIKIIDECHLEFRNILLIDLLSNVYKSWYLSATPARSNKDEQSIFKYVFSNTLYHRRKDSDDNMNTALPRKWVSYTTIHIDTHLNPNIYRYKVNRGKSMNAVSYGKFVIKNDKKLIHFKVSRDLLRELFNKDEQSKVIIFVPLIEITEELQYFLKTQLSYDETFPFDLDIKTMTSKCSQHEKERAKKADVIITTIGSCGTGTDLPGLTCVIAMSPFASAVTAQQVFGRLRYCGKMCYYYDIIDESVPADTYFWKARKKVFEKAALEVHQMSYEPDD